MTFNIRGLTPTKYSALMKLLQDHKIDIALIQETHLKGNTDEQNFTEILENTVEAEWTTVWHNDHHHSKARGIAIWIRTNRTGRAPIHLHPHTIKKQGTGRMITFNIEWAGHRLRIGNVYMPTTSTPDHWSISTALITQIKANTHANTGIIYAGDWNFIEDQCLDTTSKRRTNNKQEQYLIKYWQQMLGNTIQECQQETLRQRDRYTQHHGTPAGTIHSRLDRYYISPDIDRYIIQPIKTIEIHSYGLTSDHKPVIMSVVSKTPTLETSTNANEKVYMRRIKTAAKCHQDTMEEARNQFHRFLTRFQDGIWLDTHMDESDRYSRILKHYPHIKKELGKIWNQASHKALDILKRDLEHARHQGIDRHIKDCKRMLSQGQQANRLDSHSCIPNDSMDILSYQLLQKPKSKNFIGALKDPKSNYTYNSPKTIANCLVNTIADVSQMPDTTAAAQFDMLHLITADDETIFPRFSNPSSEITPQEVSKALRKMRNSSPGDDGLQIIHYRKFSKWMCPILATLFSAIIKRRELPANFHNGTIRAIEKGGNITDPANYRPITLLNVDYRIFGFILKERMTLSLQNLIPPTQTAFLPGRQAAENIWAVQTIPYLLHQENREALIALCDFRKAYDTIDRHFLFQICRKLQMPEYMIGWIEVMLTDTKSRVYANHCFSDYRSFFAGLRQGCPASPTLYLLIGYILARLIQKSQLGITVKCPLQTTPDLDATDMKICLFQFADDSKLIIEEDQVPLFRAVMARFAEATGQHLNKAKTKLLPIGMTNRLRTLQQIDEFTVTDQAKILGITLHSGIDPPTYQWQTKMRQLQKLTDKIKRMTGLSIFAKMDLFNKFVTSKLLYAAEFIHTPPSIIEGITKLAKQLLPPDARCWKTEGIQTRADLGGLGMLPFQKHIKARQYKWLIRLLTLGTTTIWSTLIWNATAYYKQTTREHKVMALQLLTQPCDLPGVHPAMMEHEEANAVSFNSLINTVFSNPTAIQHWNFCWYTYKGEKVPIQKYTVKAGTKLLILNSADPETWRQNVDTQRNWIHKLSEIKPQLGTMLGNLRKWWRAKVPNPWKEIIWHINSGGLLVSHIPAERLKACACGHAQASMEHCARDCPIAKHVYSLLKPGILYEDINSHFQLLVHNIWSNTTPKDIDPHIWTVISILTINALDVGRKTAYRMLHHSTREQRQHPQEIVRKASQTAEQYFWETLQHRKSQLPPRSNNKQDLPFLKWKSTTHRWKIQKPLVWTLTRNNILSNSR